jgi:hypothetical protein
MGCAFCNAFRDDTRPICDACVAKVRGALRNPVWGNVERLLEEINTTWKPQVEALQNANKEAEKETTRLEWLINNKNCIMWDSRNFCWTLNWGSLVGKHKFKTFREAIDEALKLQKEGLPLA